MPSDAPITFGERARLHRERLAQDPEYRTRHQAELLREYEREREEVQKKAAEKVRAQRWAALPARVASVFDKPLQPTPSVEAAREFRQQRRYGTLILGGPPGVGKSVAAAEVMHYHGAQNVYRDGKYVAVPVPMFYGCWVHARDLARAGTYGEEARDFWEELETEPLLVVDDLGTRKLDQQGYALSNLGDLLCARHDGALRTVITTNLPLDDFRGKFLGSDGGRLLDRFREGGNYHWALGPSLRSREP